MPLRFVRIEPYVVPKRSLTGDALRAWRQEKVPPLRDGLLKWMNAVEPTISTRQLGRQTCSLSELKKMVSGISFAQQKPSN